jgi:uncharacterized alkaline shock family protein YloU
VIQELAPAAERGRLEIHPAVLRKIVEHAADQVPGTLRHERRLAGIDIGEAGASARVTTGSGDPSAVDVRLELTLQYPGSVRPLLDRVPGARWWRGGPRRWATSWSASPGTASGP